MWLRHFINGQSSRPTLLSREFRRRPRLLPENSVQPGPGRERTLRVCPDPALRSNHRCAPPKSERRAWPAGKLRNFGARSSIVTIAGAIWGVAAIFCLFRIEVELRGQGVGLVAAGLLPLFMTPVGHTCGVGRHENSGRLDRSTLCRSTFADRSGYRKIHPTIINPNRSATRCEAMLSHDVL